MNPQTSKNSTICNTMHMLAAKSATSAMPLHAPQFLEQIKTMALAPEQTGSIVILYSHLWTAGQIQQCPQSLPELVGTKPETFQNDIWPAIQPFFDLSDTGTLSPAVFALGAALPQPSASQ